MYFKQSYRQTGDKAKSCKCTPIQNEAVTQAYLRHSLSVVSDLLMIVVVCVALHRLQTNISFSEQIDLHSCCWQQQHSPCIRHRLNTDPRDTCAFHEQERKRITTKFMQIFSITIDQLTVTLGDRTCKQYVYDSIKHTMNSNIWIIKLYIKSTSVITNAIDSL